jgi:negative regulator of genetic competence, sporulation and motility
MSVHSRDESEDDEEVNEEVDDAKESATQSVELTNEDKKYLEQILQFAKRPATA